MGRFDNRDCGESTLLSHLPPPNEVVLALRERLPGRLNRGAAPYSLDEMAEDLVLLLDGLGVNRCHLVGASMGGPPLGSPQVSSQVSSHAFPLHAAAAIRF
eukprot:SAG11_NODE_3347_length_2507_cov_1.937733_4_plen_101_part_00